MQPFAAKIIEAFARSKDVAIGVVDLDGRILTANEGLACVAGRDVDDVIGAALWDKVVRAEDEPGVRAVLAALAAGAPAMSAENPWQRPDGTLQPMRWFNMPLHDADGVVRSVLGFGYDATLHQSLRARAEEAERRFVMFEEAVEEVFYISDLAAGNLLYASPGFETLWERPIADLLADVRLFMDRIHPEDRPHVERTLNRQLAGERTEMEYRLRFPDDRIRWIRDRSYPIADSSGTVHHVVGVASDVTTHREALERLADREQVLTAVFNRSTHALWLLSPTGDILESNSTARELIAAASVAHVLSLPWASEEDRAIVASLLRDTLAGAPQRHDVQLQVERQPVVLDLTVQVVPSSAGAPRYLLAEALDITERLATRRERDEAEQRLALAIEATSEGVWDWNLVNDNAFYSPRWCRNLGYAPEEVVPHTSSWCALVHPDEHDAVCSTLQALREGTVDHFRLEVRLRTRDGDWFWVLSRGRVVGRDHTGRPARVVGTDTDIGQLKRAEARMRSLNGTLEERVLERTGALEKANRAKDEFLAVMSHELRTPLMAVLGVAESLDEGIYGPINGTQHDALQLLATSGQHLLSLIGDLLDLSKLEVNRLEVRYDRVSVAGFAQDVAHLAAGVASRAGQTIDVRLGPDLGELEVDLTRMRQVLLNLLENAVKFSPSGSTIAFTITAVEQDVTFSVSDQGPGIPLDDLPRLFRPFEQLDMQLARRYGGVGLGLALVHRLTAQHRGRVEVDSLPGHGSRFAVVLPREQSLPAASAERRGRLLLVGDFDAASRRLERWLTDVGYEVFTALDVPDALRRAGPTAPDVLLIDADAAALDLVSDRSLHRLPVVVLLTVATSETRLRLRDAFGDAAVVDAPVRIDDLLAALVSVRKRG
jgi:PAS domain S-box-containing protein